MNRRAGAGVGARASHRASCWAVIGLIVLAALVRAAVVAPGWGRAVEDPDQYLPLAGSLARGEGYRLPGDGRPTAYRPPLYPIVLAAASAVALGCRAGATALGLNVLLGAAAVALTHRSALRWGLTPRGALLAAAIVAFDPVLAVQARAVMTETLAAMLAALTLYLLAAPRGLAAALGGGVGLGLCALCRPSMLPAAGLIVLGSVVIGPGTRRERWGRAVVLSLATVLTLAPWAVRNALVLGRPVWTTTHGGHTLALANNPYYYRDVLDGPPGAVWSGPGQDAWFAHVGRLIWGKSEIEADRLLRAEGLAMLRTRPVDFARASLARLGRLWGLAPSRSVYPFEVRLLTALWTAPLWTALLWGLFQRDIWRWPRLAAPAFLIALTGLHAFFWTDLRMRAPLTPAIALIVVAPWATLRPPTREPSEAEPVPIGPG